MNDLVSHPPLAHLNAAQARLAAIAARPKPLAIACIATLTALGWIACGLIPAPLGSTWPAVLCRPSLSAAWAFTDVSLVFAMWAAMSFAMMLPTASPMILTYSEIADTAARVGERVVTPFVLIAGYVIVWLGFALTATLMQVALAAVQLDIATNLLAGFIVFGAGLYQFSSLKHACLHLCQRPFPFFFANWTDTARGVFKLGLRQGIYCLGCCWALMLVMLAVGAMNLLWMAVLGVLMTIEKMTTTTRFSRVLGLILMAGGAALIASEFM